MNVSLVLPLPLAHSTPLGWPRTQSAFHDPPTMSPDRSGARRRRGRSWTSPRRLRPPPPARRRRTAAAARRRVGVAPAPPPPPGALLLLLLLLLGAARRLPLLAAFPASPSASSRSASSADALDWRAAGDGATSRNRTPGAPARDGQRRRLAPPPTTHHAGVRRRERQAESPGAGRRTPARASGGLHARGSGGSARGSRRGRRARAGRRPTTRTRGGTRGGPATGSHQCTAPLLRPVPAVPAVPTMPRSDGAAVRTPTRRRAEELVRDFAHPRRRRRRATAPPRASHTWTYPAPVPANTVCPSSLTRTHVNGDAGSRARSHEAARPAHRASHRNAVRRPDATILDLDSPGRTTRPGAERGARGAGERRGRAPRAVPRRAREPGRRAAATSTISTESASPDVVATYRPSLAHARLESDRATLPLSPRPRLARTGAYRSPSDSLRMSVRNAPRKPLAVATASVEPQAGENAVRTAASPEADTAADAVGGLGRHTPSSVTRARLSACAERSKAAPNARLRREDPPASRRDARDGAGRQRAIGGARGAGPGALADGCSYARATSDAMALDAPGARPRLVVVVGGAAKRRVREALPAVDGAGDANQSVRHARNAARRRRGRRAGLRGRARER